MKPIDILNQALTLEEGKRITISFPAENRKKFMSLKASLYEAKKSVKETMKITTKTNPDGSTSLSIEKEPLLQEESFTLTIENSDDFQFHKDIQEIENTKTQKKKLKPGQLEVEKLEQEKESFVQEFSAFMKENKDEVLIPNSPAWTTAFEMQGKLSFLGKKIRDTKTFYGIEPTRTPATLDELIKQEEEFIKMSLEEEEMLKKMEEKRKKMEFF